MTARSILLVEDDPQDEMLILRALKKANVANHIGLPRLSGLKVLERVYADERSRLLPVVMLTSSDEERDRLQGYLKGANSFVRKPVDFAMFAETVARLGIYWLATNDPPPNH